MDNSGKLVEVFNHAYRTSDYQRLCAELGISYVSVDALDLDDNQLALKVQKYVNE
jgi:hypothetical protein